MEFSNLYPKLKQADSLGLTLTSPDYRNYVQRYNLKRDEARSLWRSKKLGEVNLIFKALHAKLDSLQKLPVQINEKPVSVKAIKNANDSTKVDSLIIQFGAPNTRVNVTWKGVVEGYPMDSLLTELSWNSRKMALSAYVSMGRFTGSKKCRCWCATRSTPLKW